jgi:hypothetical protein
MTAQPASTLLEGPGSATLEPSPPLARTYLSSAQKAVYSPPD